MLYKCKTPPNVKDLVQTKTKTQKVKNLNIFFLLIPFLNTTTGLINYFIKINCVFLFTLIWILGNLHYICSSHYISTAALI